MRSIRSVVTVLSAMLLTGCRVSTQSAKPARLQSNGKLQVRVLLSESFGPGVQMAARDLVEAMAQVAGVAVPEDAITTDPNQVVGKPVVSVTVTSVETHAIGEQGFRLESGNLGGGASAVAVVGRSEVGAMYGIYRLIWDLGVRYYHPDATFFPYNPEATLPFYSEPLDSFPAFERRGFHEHTQHPIPAADFLLNPEYPGAREAASRYLKWLARNRQNILTFHLLKTVDLKQWLPYIKDIVDEAHSYGIRVGVVVSFADRQQNAYRLLDALGELEAEKEQIRVGLDQLLDHVAEDPTCPDCPVCPYQKTKSGLVTGPPKRGLFDFVGLQFGTTEFTSPGEVEGIAAEVRAIEWLNTALDHLKTNYCQRDGLKQEYYEDEDYPYVRAFAWVHVPCSVKTEEGGLYFHLPLQAEADVGVFVHTTMFYDLEHPAPVYGCENFHHQREFLKAALGQGRRTVFFPETAWWLGFDNNVPLILPITGRSRAEDLAYLEGLRDGKKLYGHVTFTTGREWTYWMYDHFLEWATWSADLTWESYLESISPMFGADGESAVEVLKDWTNIQYKYFFEKHPLLYYYLAGELPQDEAGVVAGVWARPTKLPFRDVVSMEDEEYEKWLASDLQTLEDLRADLIASKSKLPSGTDANIFLRELRTSMDLFVMRIDHALALYRGAIAARKWVKERKAAAAENREPNASVRDAALEEAQARLEDAQSITERVKAIVAQASYREPLEQVARERPDSLTAYKFGYLYEASTAYFWARRDAQLANLIAQVFGVAPEEYWESEPDIVMASDANSTTVLVPDNDFARAVMVGFIPRMLWGLRKEGPLLVVAEDFDETGLPDPGTEATVFLIQKEDILWGQTPQLPILMRDQTGNLLGTAVILEPEFSVSGAVEGEARLTSVKLEGHFETQALVALVVSVTMGGIDQEGVEGILRDMFGIGHEEPLPDRLPVVLEFRQASQ